MRLALACFACLVITIPAGAARTDLSVVAPAPVSVLAADGELGQRVAYLSSAANGGCGAVGLWKPGRPVRQLPVRCGPNTSTGRGAYGLSFGRVLLWATYTGGNFREHTLWRSMREGSPAPTFGRGRPVARVTHNVDSPSPLLVGEGDDPWASYAVGDTAYKLSTDVRRSWRLPGPALGLIAHGPYLTVRRADGPVSVYAHGQQDEMARIDYLRGEVLAVKAHSALIAVLRRGELDIHHAHGLLRKTLRLPAARSYGDDHCGTDSCPLADLRLADLQGSLAVYIHGRAIHVLRVTDRRDVVVRRPAVGPVHVELEATGLSYSAGRRVFFIPRAEIDRLLR